MPAPYTAFTAFQSPPQQTYLSPAYQSTKGILPQWGSWSFEAGIVGVGYDRQWDMPWSPPITYALLSGSLPPGLSLASINRTEGHIFGTPTTAGTYSFVLQATNDYGSQNFSGTIVISGAPSTLAPLWAIDTMPNGAVGSAYTIVWDMPVSAVVTYSVHAGSLPTGLSLSAVSGNEAQVSGTPTVAGTYSFTLRAVNAYGTADQAFSVTISATSGGGSFTWITG